MDNYTDIPKEHYPTIDDFPGDLLHVAKIIETVCPSKGVEAVLALTQYFRGTHVYFRNIDCLFKKARNAWLIEEYSNGQSVACLARKVGLSERQIWKIIGN